MKRLTFFGVLTAAVFFISQLGIAPTALAQTPTPTRTIEGDQISWGGSFKLQSNETLEGDLTIMGGDAVLRGDSVVTGDVTIMGGNVAIEEKARVDGDIALFGGTLTTAGDVDGDLMQFGGSVTLADTARVGGKFERVGGSRTVAPGANINKGGVDIGRPLAESAAEIAPPAATAAVAPTAEARNPVQRALRAVRDAIRDDGDDRDITVVNTDGDSKVLPGALIITLLAVLCAVLIPRNVAQAVMLARTQTILTGGVGFLSLIAGAIVLGVLSIMIITIPITLTIGVIAVITGWTVTAQLAGEQVMRFFNRSGWQPLTVIMAGSVAMALLGAIPIIGDVLGVAFVSIGLGAFVLTRGGTRPYQYPTETGVRAL
jgi:cytoskeletal protein CcmA (bactofilin family)